MFNEDERYVNKSLMNELLILQFNLRPFIFCVLKLKQKLKKTIVKSATRVNHLKYYVYIILH
jgi:hypothetical protein